jgi:hypothetical protein
MIRCATARRWIVRALADDLPERRRPLLAAHLAGCAACRARARDQAALVQEIADSPVPEPGPAYWDSFPGRVRERIRVLASGAAAPAALLAAAVRQERACRLALAASVVLALALGIHESRSPAPPERAAAALARVVREPGLAALVLPADLEAEDPGLELEELYSELDRDEALSLRSRLEREIGIDRFPPEDDENES